ncbi:hypothetical protein [Shewanella frigidimarina]|uniref:hypothetical protein n=1 Tax=Shewanella frigidimarina TaxID=56812 RepID=UPI003D7A5466
MSKLGLDFGHKVPPARACDQQSRGTSPTPDQKKAKGTSLMDNSTKLLPEDFALFGYY